MIRTWLNFPLRLGLCLVLLMIILLWQFNFDLASSYYQTAHTYQYVDEDYRLALMSYEMSLNYRPNDAQTNYQIGVTYMRMGNREQAIIQIERALNQGYEPRERALLQIIRLLENAGRLDEAATYQTELERQR